MIVNQCYLFCDDIVYFNIRSFNLLRVWLYSFLKNGVLTAVHSINPYWYSLFSTYLLYFSISLRSTGCFFFLNVKFDVLLLNKDIYLLILPQEEQLKT